MLQMNESPMDEWSRQMNATPSKWNKSLLMLSKPIEWVLMASETNLI
jgi:hypothetical protein